MDVKRILNIVIVSILVVGMIIIAVLFKEENPQKQYAALEKEYCEYAVSFAERYPDEIGLDFSKPNSYQNIERTKIVSLAALEDKTLPIELINPLESTESKPAYFSDSVKIKVLIKENGKVEAIGFTDVKNYPKIDLIGGNKITITLGEQFVDPGYKAFDEEDGDLTNKVVRNNTLDLENIGEYLIIYSVIDSDGNITSEIREVIIK